MKTVNIFVFTLLFCISTVYAQRVERLLSGNDWAFVLDYLKKGEEMGYPQALPTTKNLVNVPHTWNVNPLTEHYVGTAWYEKEFEVPAEWKGRTLRLKFNAVYRDATIYINGKKAGSHYNSGYTVFYVDITDLAQVGKNRLTVSVNNDFSIHAIPYAFSFDWANDGGIIRDVYLIATGNTALKYLHIDAEIDGKTKVKTRLWEDTALNELAAKVSILSTEGKLLVENEQLLKRNQNGEYHTTVHVPNPSLWHFDHPNLYTVSIEVNDGNNIKDKISQRYGYRKIEIKGDKLYLNNEPIRLPGIEWMPGSHPDYGMAEPKEVWEESAKLIKNTNSIITRFHWQQDPALLDWFDENGMLVQIELPWWQQPASMKGELLETAKTQLKNTIENDYNHPSIFAWAISNEVGQQPVTDAQVLVDYVRSLDKDRFVNIVTNNIQRRLKTDQSLIGDIPTWNEYIGTWAGASREELPGHLVNIHKILNGKPLLITEAGLCEPRFEGGDERRIEDMKYHYDQWASAPWIIGTIYFSLNDYRTHMGETGEGRMKQRWHGLVDVYNQSKPSYYKLSELHAPLKIVEVKGNSVKLYCINSLPSYSIKGYYLIAKDKKISLPDMAPGEEITVKIPKNTSYFEIFRPTGFRTTRWER